MADDFDTYLERQRSVIREGFDRLEDAQQALLTKIVRGRLAWTPVEQLETAGHTVETLGELVTAGLVVLWRLPRDLVATLTPLGAEVCEVEIIERIRVLGCEIEEDPVWRRRPARWPDLVLPNRSGEVRLPWMEAFPDPLPGPEVLIDEETEAPVKLFEGEDKTEIDARLKGGIGSGPASKGVVVVVKRKGKGGAAKSPKRKAG